jgi:lambda repressor-like predicted transcriptional regulator
VSEHKYDPEPLRQLLVELLKKTGESHRKASLAAGLPSNAISKYLKGTRPSRHACVALADHFGVNPNEILQAAGYEPLHFFDRSLIQPGELSPEVKALAAQLQQIKDPTTRRRVIEAMKTLISPYLQVIEPQAIEPERKPVSSTTGD